MSFYFWTRFIFITLMDVYMYNRCYGVLNVRDATSFKIKYKSVPVIKYKFN